jgi:lipoteichoic acid synthase
MPPAESPAKPAPPPEPGGPARRWWLLLPALFLIARLVSLAAFYLVPTPNGHRVAPDAWGLGRVSVLSELGSFLVVSGLVGLALWRASPRARAVVWHVALVALAGYALMAEVDVHLARWMGLRLNLVFLRHFLSAAGEGGFWSQLFTQLGRDLPSVVLSLALIIAPVVIALGLRPGLRLVRARGHAAMALAGALALVWSADLAVAVRKWRIMAPVPYRLAMDLAHDLGGARRPATAEQIAALRELIAPRDADARYPMWHRAPAEAQSLAAFRARPPGERPDVFMFAIESLRGWVADWRSPRMAALAPNLTALWRERGVAFVRAHSNGYPSGEGNANLNLGIWSHPSRALPADHVSIRSRGLPEILRQAGYQTVWFTGSDPSFDNLQHFVARWYDRWELHEKGDVGLARGVIAAYDRLPPDAPRMLSVYTYSTHPFYALPPEEGPRPADAEQAYLRALSYADRALGMVIDHVRRAGRMNRTLFVVTGDHSQPTPWHLQNDEQLGPPNAGRTWTGMLIAGPGIEAAGLAGSVREDASSHADIPPTLLGQLGIDASHHFLGRDLFHQPAPRPVVAVFQDSASLVLGDTMLIGDLAGETLRKFRYDEGPLSDPLGYRHGAALPTTADDQRAFARVRQAVTAYAWLLDHDLLEPPAEDSPHAARHTGRKNANDLGDMGTAMRK